MGLFSGFNLGGLGFGKHGGGGDDCDCLTILLLLFLLQNINFEEIDICKIIWIFVLMSICGCCNPCGGGGPKPRPC